MASVADICNMALSHIGSDTVVTSIAPPDGSIEAGHCARFYPIVRKEALESHKFTWSKKRVALSEVTNPSEVWTYAYALPSDCLTAARVLQRTYVVDMLSLLGYTSTTPVVTSDELQMWTERGSAHFEVEGQTLLTHEPDAVLLYTRDITDTTKFSTHFVVYMSYLLASYLAGPIIKGEPGATAGGRFRQAADNMQDRAAALDANQSSSRAEHVPEHIRRR